MRLRLRSLPSLLAALVLVAAASGVGPSRATAQPTEGIEPIGEFRDWYAFQYEEEGSPVCFMVSRPKRAEGNYTRRGEVYMMITHRPGRRSRDVLSILTGYTYREDSDATITVDGGDRFVLFTEGENAWALDGEIDQAAIAAMRSGVEAVARGISSRGTETTDTYSLLGFTSAYNAISEACPPQ